MDLSKIPVGENPPYDVNALASYLTAAGTVQPAPLDRIARLD